MCWRCRKCEPFRSSSRMMCGRLRAGRRRSRRRSGRVTAAWRYTAARRRIALRPSLSRASMLRAASSPPTSAAWWWRAFIFPRAAAGSGTIAGCPTSSTSTAPSLIALSACAAGGPVFVTGDYNTAHEAIDLARPKGNVKNSGFLPEERAEISRWLDAGWVDTFRARHPDAPGHYTWWRQFGGARGAQCRLAHRLCPRLAVGRQAGATGLHLAGRKRLRSLTRWAWTSPDSIGVQNLNRGRDALAPGEPANLQLRCGQKGWRRMKFGARAPPPSKCVLKLAKFAVFKQGEVDLWMCAR